MKRKESFVTNSSSVSFIGFGIEHEGDLPEITSNLIKTVYKEKYAKEFPENNETLDWIDLILPKMLDYSSVPWGNNGKYIGGTYIGMPDDITKKEFHEQIKKYLEDLGFDTKNIGVIDEVWRDG